MTRKLSSFLSKMQECYMKTCENMQELFFLMLISWMFFLCFHYRQGSLSRFLLLLITISFHITICYTHHFLLFTHFDMGLQYSSNAALWKKQVRSSCETV